MEEQREKSALEKAQKIMGETPTNNKDNKEIKNQKNKKGKGQLKKSYIVAIVMLSISTIVLASILTIKFIVPSKNDMALESKYQRSYLDTVEEVDNIDINLSKVLATKDSKAIQKYLVDLAVESELCESNISNLPIMEEYKFYTTKLINQIGDYSKYLNKKIINGESLTEKEINNLSSLYNYNQKLKQTLQNITQNMESDFKFSSIKSGDKNTFIAGLEELENLSVKYPELIYDGPFSDGKESREIKGLNGYKEVSESQAKEIFKDIFNVNEIKDVGTSEGFIKCYNFSAEEGEKEVFAEISKKGGKLISFSTAGSCKKVNYEREQAIKKGKEFIEKLGIENITAVWVNLTNNVYTINYTKETNGIIIYPDMIKVRVCAETLDIIGFEASSYYINHKERVINSPSITEEKAREKVVENMIIDSTRLVVIPLGESAEKLCYEFSGTIDNSTFYVYIDAENGNQLQMFKVVKTLEGTLLI